jgi:hypothetical protein
MSVEDEQIETQEEAVVESQEVVEQEQAPDDDAAFLAGFNEAVTGEVSTPEPEPEPEPEPVRIAGYTEDELKELLAKAQEVDRLKEREAKIWGTLGSMKQAIESRANSATPKVTKESFKRLSSEFPEMAEMLADDLSQISMPSGGFDPSSVEKVIEERLDRERKVNETKILSVMHPDWQQVVRDESFATWKETLSDEAKQVLNDGWDAILIGEGLSAFKEWKSKTTQTAASKRQRLESAIAPKTVIRSAPVQTAEDAFTAGFNSVRGRK